MLIFKLSENLSQETKPGVKYKDHFGARRREGRVSRAPGKGSLPGSPEPVDPQVALILLLFVEHPLVSRAGSQK